MAASARNICTQL